MRAYRHGPLARMELGHNSIQGVDYAYTLQGWLKGVNSTGLWRTTVINDDMGADATGPVGTTPNSLYAEDAFGFALYYNPTDYQHIGPSGLMPFAVVGGSPTAGHAGKSFEHATFTITRNGALEKAETAGSSSWPGYSPNHQWISLRPKGSDRNDSMIGRLAMAHQ